DYPTFALWIGGILRDPKSVREETAKRIFKSLHNKTDFKP
ncbi:replication initiation protein, partial [Acinetobacter sichuanensis]